MMTVFDRDGNAYSMTNEEAQAALSSGAYTSKERNEAKAEVVPMIPAPSVNGKVTVIEKKTGKAYQMRTIDAREAVKTGYFEMRRDQPAIQKKAPEIASVAQKQIYEQPVVASTTQVYPEMYQVSDEVEEVSDEYTQAEYVEDNDGSDSDVSEESTQKRRGRKASKRY